MSRGSLVVALLLFSSLSSVLGSSAAPGRQKRSLLFPDPSLLILIFGLGTPLQLDRESVIVGMFSKMQYKLPSNASTVEIARQREEPPESRWSLYRRLGRLAELHGLAKPLDGRACVLRAICEVAAAPFDPTHGLLHQLLQIFFSPSSTPPEPYEEYRDREYEAAEALGGRGLRACPGNFEEDCPISLLDVFTRLP